MSKKILVVLNLDFGFESVDANIFQQSSGTWLGDVEAIVLRVALANPLPHIVSRGGWSEFFINFNHILRIEVLH
jgi:hypothetical protein